MNENFNDGNEAIETLKHHKVTAGELVAIIVVCNIIGACALKGADWLKKRRQAKINAEFENDDFFKLPEI